MKTLLNAILTKLQEITELKYIDEDWNQLSDYPNSPVKFPCALVDFQIPFKMDYLNKQQTDTYSISIVVCTSRLSNSSRNAPANQKQKAFEIYDIVDKIHDKLHGWSPTNDAQRLIDKSLSKEYQNGIKKMTMTFEVDYTKPVKTTRVPVMVGLRVMED